MYSAKPTYRDSNLHPFECRYTKSSHGHIDPDGGFDMILPRSTRILEQDQVEDDQEEIHHLESCTRGITSTQDPVRILQDTADGLVLPAHGFELVILVGKSTILIDHQIKFRCDQGELVSYDVSDDTVRHGDEEKRRLQVCVYDNVENADYCQGGFIYRHQNCKRAQHALVGRRICGKQAVDGERDREKPRDPGD